jgi:hypothetical protein
LSPCSSMLRSSEAGTATVGQPPRSDVVEAVAETG